MFYLNQAQARSELERWLACNPTRLQEWIQKRAFPVVLAALVKQTYVRKKSILATPLTDKYGDVQHRNLFVSGTGERVVRTDVAATNVQFGETVGELDVTQIQPVLNQLSPTLDYLMHRFPDAADKQKLMKMTYADATRLAEEWHGEVLRQARRAEEKRIREERTVVNEGINVHFLVDASFCHKSDWYSFRSYITAKGLRYEGDSLHHCVACFWDEVKTGEIRIVGITKNNSPLLTLAFNVEHKYLIQNRGLQNRLPTADEDKLFQPILFRVYGATNAWFSYDDEEDVALPEMTAFSYDPENWQRWKNAISQVL